MMGGTIRLESDEGYGSTFSFVIPFGVAQAIAKSSPPLLDIQPDRQRTPLKILLVEDNKVNRMWAVEIIRMWGNTVVEAEYCQEALEKLRTEKIDFVLMDVCVPVMDGVEATRRIWNGEAGDPAIPLIAMTAYALKGDRDKLLNTGMNDYIAKPVDIEELDRVLERVMRKYCSLQALCPWRIPDSFWSNTRFRSYLRLSMGRNGNVLQMVLPIFSSSVIWFIVSTLP